MTFYKFYRDFKIFERISLGFKYDEISDFYALLSTFINTHEATTSEKKDLKDRVIRNVNQLYDKYFDPYKKNYDSEKVKDKEKKGVTINSLKWLIWKNKNQSGLKKKLREKCKSHYGLK